MLGFFAVFTVTATGDWQYVVALAVLEYEVMGSAKLMAEPTFVRFSLHADLSLL